MRHGWYAPTTPPVPARRIARRNRAALFTFRALAALPLLPRPLRALAEVVRSDSAEGQVVDPCLETVVRAAYRATLAEDLAAEALHVQH